MEEDTPEGVTYQCRVRPETRLFFDGLRDRTGMPAVQIVARMCDFYARQSEDVKAQILLRDGNPERLIALEWNQKQAEADRQPIQAVNGVDRETLIPNSIPKPSSKRRNGGRARKAK